MSTKEKNPKRDPWVEDHARSVRREARKRAGVGWSLLGPELRNALISDQIVNIVLVLSDETLDKNPTLAKIAEVARRALNVED